MPDRMSLGTVQMGKLQAMVQVKRLQVGWIQGDPEMHRIDVGRIQAYWACKVNWGLGFLLVAPGADIVSHGP